MPPSGLAILIGAGPNTGTGIARILASSQHGNLAVALLARGADNLARVKGKILEKNSDSVVETFQSDTTEGSINKAFDEIKSHPSFQGLKLKVAVYSVKHSAKKPFLEETREAFSKSLDEYVGGAQSFAQAALKRLFADHGDKPLAEGSEKKGTIIFTGTLGAMRTNPQYASYGAGRSGVRMLAQALAKEYSPLGVHVVHAIMNGPIRDEDGPDESTGKVMAADAVGLEYLHLANQPPTLWTHELDMRPAQEKF